MLCVGDENELHGMQPLPPQRVITRATPQPALPDRIVGFDNESAPQNVMARLLPSSTLTAGASVNPAESACSFQLLWKDLPGPLLYRA
jgi:hypothetical protein